MDCRRPMLPSLFRRAPLASSAPLGPMNSSSFSTGNSSRKRIRRHKSSCWFYHCPDADVGDGGAAAAAASASSSSVEEWSEIDLRDPPPAAAASDKPKHKAFVPPWKSRGKKELNASRPPLDPVEQNNSKNASSVLMAESSPSEAMPTGKTEKGKRRHLTAMFQHGGGGGNGSENKELTAASMEGTDQETDASKSKKKSSWGFDGLKKWKKASNEEATAGGERPECAAPRSSYSECRLEASPAVAKGQEEAAYGHR